MLLALFKPFDAVNYKAVLGCDDRAKVLDGTYEAPRCIFSSLFAVNLQKTQSSVGHCVLAGSSGSG